MRRRVAAARDLPQVRVAKPLILMDRIPTDHLDTQTAHPCTGSGARRCRERQWYSDDRARPPLASEAARPRRHLRLVQGGPGPRQPAAEPRPLRTLSGRELPGRREDHSLPGLAGRGREAKGPARRRDATPTTAGCALVAGCELCALASLPASELGGRSAGAVVGAGPSIMGASIAGKTGQRAPMGRSGLGSSLLHLAPPPILRRGATVAELAVTPLQRGLHALLTADATKLRDRRRQMRAGVVL